MHAGPSTVLARLSAQYYVHYRSQAIPEESQPDVREVPGSLCSHFSTVDGEATGIQDSTCQTIQHHTIGLRLSIHH